MAYQIIYSSEAATPMQTGDLEEILDHARRSNAVTGITGALVYAEGVFLQILEGDSVRVQALMAAIRRDVRHQNLVVLREGEIACAVFGSWKMAYVSATPQQVARWAGLGLLPGGTDSPREEGEEQHRTAQFAQDILALLEVDKAPETMITIIPATPADAAVIHDIQMRAFAEEGRLSDDLQIPPLAEEIAAIELHIRTQTVLTARDGERIVGSARGIVDGPVCTIRGVSVEPSWQGRGIGASLVRAVEQAHPDIQRFALTTNTLVPGNVSFYERRGYRVAELTSHTDKIVLAQMVKVIGATDA